MMLVSVRSFSILWISIGLSLFAKMACAQMYTADLTNSEWKVSAGPFACSLSHNIPIFGKAVFARKAGGAETFYLESQGNIVFPVGFAGAETLPPQWRNDLVPIPLGAFSVVAGNHPITLNAKQIASLVTQLTAGTNVMYSSQPLAKTSSSPSVMRVVLNAKNFNAGYKSYQQCVDNIIPYGFAQVERTSIYYAEKAEGLTAGNKADLNKVARYTKADAKVVGVLVDGHSDNAGAPAENEATSKQLAELVAAYLVEKGVAADKITTRWHGDKFVIANNKDATGRAKNRRVTVRLEDEAGRKDAVKKAEEKRKVDEKAAAEKVSAETKSATADANGSTSSKAKMTPEEVSRMVEGYDLTKPK